MKHLKIFLLAGYLFFSVVSCSKNFGNSFTSTTKILGKWNVVNDSSYQGVGAENKLVTYIGHAGDYYDFRTDGKLYTNVNSILDTFKYSITSNSAILLNSLSALALGDTTYTSDQLQLSTRSARIYQPFLYTPGGAFGMIVNLSK